MALLNKTKTFSKVIFGSERDKTICKVSWGHSAYEKKIAAASNTAVHAAITMGATAQTVTTSITNPDVPRVLVVKPAGTAADIGNGLVVITGTNVEGKTITDSFQLVDASTTAITGAKAFKTVTSIAVPASEGTGGTISVGTSSGLGVYHRLFPSNTTVKVVLDDTSTRSIDTAPTITDADEVEIERNIITPATSPNGTYRYDIYYIYDYWTLADINDNPIYLTSTSTSSTSTSTTTSYTTTSTSSTSTSSTSSSTSSTSSSTSSTSSSTSSTSSSTSTTP